jgi:hypothetical protein
MINLYPSRPGLRCPAGPLAALPLLATAALSAAVAYAAAIDLATAAPFGGAVVALPLAGAGTGAPAGPRRGSPAPIPGRTGGWTRSSWWAAP